MFQNINEIEALVERLIDKLDESKTDSIELEIDDVKIKLNKHTPPPHDHILREAPVYMQNESTTPHAEPAPTVTATAAASTVNAPLIGVAYAAPSPDAAPFVKVGDRVKKGDVICIIEAMKVMNEIEADKDGEVAEILFENGKMVEYGEPLISLK